MFKKKLNQRRLIAAAIAASSLALLTGCGASGGGAAPAPVAPATGAGLIGGGCVPINQTTTIPFQMTGLYIGSEAAGDMRVLGGTVPPGDQLASGTYGVVSLMNGAMPQPQGYSLATFQGRRVDGTSLSLTVTSPNGAVPQTGYPNAYPQTAAGGQYNATGYIQVSPFIQQLLIQTAIGASGYGINQPILNTMPGQYPAYNPAVNQQICVSNVAFSLQRTLSNYANWLYMGEVYFYLSGGAAGTNGQHGLAINF